MPKMSRDSHSGEINGGSGLFGGVAVEVVRAVAVGCCNHFAKVVLERMLIRFDVDQQQTIKVWICRFIHRQRLQQHLELW